MTAARAPVPMPAAAPAPVQRASAPFGLLQRKCACGGAGGADGECDDCKKKQTDLRRWSTGKAGPAYAPPIVNEVLNSPGQSLDPAARAFMEPRFGHDFSRVRVHADSKAAESAGAVNALAYTVGPDVVFGAGQYQPNSAAGRNLLGHELTHVVQQHGQVATAQRLRIAPSDDAYEQEAHRTSMNLNQAEDRAPQVPQAAPATVQRACLADIGHPAGCTAISGDAVGEHYLFNVNCDEFKPGEEARLRKDAAKITTGVAIEIHGFASEEGDQSFNENLSCARAIKGKTVIDSVLSSKGVSVTSTLFLHGATAGNRDDRRSITIVSRAAPTPDPVPPPEPDQPPSCTPPSTCPPDYCTPMARWAAIADRAARGPFLLAGIGAAVSPRVIPLWNLFMMGGTPTTLDISGKFAPDFTSDRITVHVTNNLLDAFSDDLRANPPVFAPGTTSTVVNIDYGPSAKAAIAKIRTPGDPDSMSFSPATTIPGNLAGGTGTNQAACPVGANPSTMNDDRLTSGTATITKDPSGGWNVDPDVTYVVNDTIDFCPGNCGTGFLVLQATVPLSRWEATGISGDVPFTVKFPAPKTGKLTVMPAKTGP